MKGIPIKPLLSEHYLRRQNDQNTQNIFTEVSQHSNMHITIAVV